MVGEFFEVSLPPLTGDLAWRFGPGSEQGYTFRRILRTLEDGVLREGCVTRTWQGLNLAAIRTRRVRAPEPVSTSEWPPAIMQESAV